MIWSADFGSLAFASSSARLPNRYIGAIAESGAPLVRGLHARAAELGWIVGTPVFVRHARVGIINELGAVLEPDVIVLLIGERPGLQVAASTERIQ
jgi:ethanolamine ammonia-lyase small subunit